MKYILFISAFLLWSCASQTSPTGGPRDKTPPKLISSNPKANQKNFKGQMIELEFDEFVKLKDPKDEILISPPMGKDVSYVVRKNKVIITPKQKWKDSTTYSISFRESVQDITESNPADNLRLAFSTGNEIDSLKITGSLRYALTDNTPQGFIVGVYQSDTFNIFKHTPGYFTKANKKGKFAIENLKPGNYFIYSFEDKNKNLKVDSKSEAFGFLTDTLRVKPKMDSVIISQVRIDARPLALNSVRHYQDRSLIRFSKYTREYKLDSIPSTMLDGYTDNSDAVEVFHYGLITDSLRVRLLARDSVEQQLDTIIYLKTSKSKYPSTNLKIETKRARIEESDKTAYIELRSNTIIRYLRDDSLAIRRDSTLSMSITLSDIEALSNHRTIIIRKKLDTAYVKPKANLTVYFPKGFIENAEKEKSPAGKTPLPITLESETGVLLIELKTKEKNFEAQLLNAEDKIVATVRNVAKHSFKNLSAGDYKLRILVDNNGNGRWDPGNVLTHQPTEKVLYYINLDGKTKFPIRSAWEVGPFVISF